MGERGGAFSVEGVPMRELRKSKPSLPGCIVPTLRKSRRVGQPVVYSLPRKAGPAPSCPQKPDARRFPRRHDASEVQEVFSMRFIRFTFVRVGLLAMLAA